MPWRADGGAVLGAYLDPWGGRPVLLVALPIDRVEPTPYQRDASDAHVRRLMGVVERIGRFLDPVIVVRHDGAYWTPNGNHRLQAMRRLGARSVTGLLVPNAEVAFKIKGIGPKKALRLVKQHGSIERMPPHVRDQVEELAPAIRALYLEPEVTGDYDVKPGACDVAGVVRFLCEERAFSEERVTAALRRAFPQASGAEPSLF